MKKIMFLVLILIIAAAFIFHFSQPKITSTETIKIGVVYSQTGAASGWGQRNLRAAQMAVDEINEDGGVDGKAIELVVEDGGTEPKSTVSAFIKLATTDDVYAIAGDVWDFVTEPMIPLSAEYKKLLIAPTVMNIPFTSKSDHYFSVGHRTESIEDAVHKFFDVNPEIKTVYVFCWKNGWGEAHEKTFEEVANQRGIKIIGKDCAYFGDDYRTQAAKAVAAKPDAVFTITADGKALTALKQQNYPGKILATSDLVSVITEQQVPNEYSNGLYIIDWIASNDFVKKYQSRYDDQYPINEASNSYHLIKALAQAYKNNPTDALAGIKTVKINTGKGVIDFESYTNTNVNRESADLLMVNQDQIIEIVE